MNPALYARITKVDAEKRIIYGRAIDETPDRSGEVFDYETSKGHFAEWSKESLEASDGKSHGNLRAMHGKVAAGKLTGIEFDDAAKAIDVAAHVVDDGEWKKVLEGVYTGFSIGGAYVKKWEDPKFKKSDGKPVTRYTAKPSELSLVDRPCVPSARYFSIQKADGVVEQAEFQKVLTDEQIEAKSRELCKAAGDDDSLTDTTDGKNIPMWKNYEAAAIAVLSNDIPSREDMLKVLTDAYGGDAITKYSDEEVAKHYAELMSKNSAAQGTTTSGASPSSEALKSAEPPAAEVNTYEVEGSDEDVAKLGQLMHEHKLAVADTIKFVEAGVAAAKAAAEQTEILAKEAVGELKKGMYAVGRLASIVQDLEYLRSSIFSEEAAEKDTTSALPGKSASLLAAATDLLRAMVQEEADELLSMATNQPTILALAHFGDLQKVGARNSSADAGRIQKVHDLAVELGCACGSKEAAAAPEDLAKGVTPDALQKAVSEALAGANAQIQELSTRLAKVEAQPATPRGVLRAVSKSADVPAGAAVPEIQPVVKSDGEVNEAASLIKAAHRQGGVELGFAQMTASNINK